MPEDPYADPVTGVLRNRLGLGASGNLEDAEREITHAALILLMEATGRAHLRPGAPVRDPSQDLRRHLRLGRAAPDRRHREGELVLSAPHIESSAAEIFRALHGEKVLRGLSRNVFTEPLTYYFGEVNAIHPFREGNGRAQRAFFEQLVGDAGFILDWQRLDADRNIAASAAIMGGDHALMRKMLDELIRES
jgi:cell filamentation protein